MYWPNLLNGKHYKLLMKQNNQLCLTIGKISKNVRHCLFMAFFIFRMLDLGFRSDVERCENHISMPRKGERQTLMFSATFPDEIQKAATRYLPITRTVTNLLSFDLLLCLIVFIFYKKNFCKSLVIETSTL